MSQYGPKILSLFYNMSVFYTTLIDQPRISIQNQVNVSLSKANLSLTLKYNHYSESRDTDLTNQQSLNKL